VQKIIIITGTVASGKSTALKILRDKFAYHIISADEVYHGLLSNGLFDDMFIKEFRTKDKVFIRERMLKSDETRNTLNEITHPKIIAEIKRLLGCLAGSTSHDNDGRKGIAIEIPLFDKINLIKHDISIFITASLKIRLNRLQKRGLSSSEAQKLIDIQLNYETQNDCDYTINNDGDETELERKLQKIISDF